MKMILDFITNLKADDLNIDRKEFEEKFDSQYESWELSPEEIDELETSSITTGHFQEIDEIVKDVPRMKNVLTKGT